MCYDPGPQYPQLPKETLAARKAREKIEKTPAYIKAHAEWLRKVNAETELFRSRRALNDFQFSENPADQELLNLLATVVNKIKNKKISQKEFRKFVGK